ncbi:UNKNOWN [Stylonychia lemnae]|uniref:FHA domain-containing protein n=1 Tax=Stylonychia lemnae TaxID=5949 RepID=A0A078AFR1_STYLE|nr:UNKNOWN [Stylonychia lemnae]|eukprot:CDW81085.1 UNKNOWN [Stylonychia lemnae]
MQRALVKLEHYRAFQADKDMRKRGSTDQNDKLYQFDADDHYISNSHQFTNVLQVYQEFYLNQNQEVRLKDLVTQARDIQRNQKPILGVKGQQATDQNSPVLTLIKKDYDANLIWQSFRLSNPNPVIKSNDKLKFGRITFDYFDFYSDHPSTLVFMTEDNQLKYSSRSKPETNFNDLATRYYCSICTKFCDFTPEQEGELKCFFKDSQSGIKYSVLDNFVQDWEQTLILQSIYKSSEENSTEMKEIYVIMKDKCSDGYKIDLGRGKECDIQIIDKSISRQHATLAVQKTFQWRGNIIISESVHSIVNQSKLDANISEIALRWVGHPPTQTRISFQKAQSL